MLEPFLHFFNSQRIILASKSPRRIEILSNVGLKVETIHPNYEENLNKTDFSTPYQYAIATASAKGKAVLNSLQNDEVRPGLIISADTVISCDGVIFEKPNDEENAFQILSKLSGKAHSVFTGVVLLKPYQTDGPPGNVTSEFYEATTVVFASLTPKIIRAYVATREPMDKAGAYAIQGIGGSFVEAIHGDYFNVMGFPLHRFCKELLMLFNLT